MKFFLNKKLLPFFIFPIFFLNAVAVKTGAQTTPHPAESDGSGTYSVSAYEKNEISRLVAILKSMLGGTRNAPETQTNVISPNLQDLLGVFEPVHVYRALNYQVEPQGVLILSGSGFKPAQNTAVIDGTYEIPHISSLLGTSLAFILPEGLSLGKHEVWVKNSNGTSRNSSTPIYFVVAENPAPAPVIDNVLPYYATEDDEITISGKGFTAKDNNIFTTLGNISGVSSADGATIKVKMSDFPHLAAMVDTPELKNTSHDMWMYVQNENGLNPSPFRFTIKIK